MDQDSAQGNGGWFDRLLRAVLPSGGPRQSARRPTSRRGSDRSRPTSRRLQAAHEGLAAEIRLVADWQRTASAHLTGLQTGHEALASEVASLSKHRSPLRR